MYCTSCGSPRPDNATACPSCGMPVQHFPPMAPVKNHLVFAVLTAFCCLPFAVIAIIYAAQVNSKLAAGDFTGAAKASARAKMWCIITVSLAVVFWIGYMVLLFRGIAGT